MRCWLVILFLACAYAGCGRPVETSGNRSLPPLEPGGSVRIHVEDAGLANRILRAAVALPLVPIGLGPAAERGDGLATEQAAGGTDCRSFVLHREAWPDGTPVAPADLINAWEAGLRDPEAPHRWLLAPVLGADDVAQGRARHASGLVAAGRTLEVCSSGPAPDLGVRLAHPALWLWRLAPSGGLLQGPGQFMESTAGVLTHNPGHAGRPALLDRIRRVEGGAAGLLLRIGEADLAVVYGSAAAELIEAGGESITVRREEGLDKTYLLWFDPRARWLSDPTFRRWLAGRIDRQGMLDRLFDARGSAAFGLLQNGEGDAPWDSAAARPLASNTVPRITLDYDGEEADSARIAARLKAELDTVGVTLLLRSRDAPAFAAAVRAGEVEAALLVHRPHSRDPILELGETVQRLGPAADGSRELLRRGARSEGAAPRTRTALAAERLLTGDAELIPLVRLEAWLAVDVRLAGVDASVPGLLRFGSAGWIR